MLFIDVDTVYNEVYKQMCKKGHSTLFFAHFDLINKDNYWANELK